MATSPAGTRYALTLERALAAPPERAFDSFTKAETLSRWFAPTDEYTCVLTEFDVRPGGRYRVEMRHSGGNVHAVHGIYEEVSRPGRLVFSWVWEDRPGDGASRVTVRFEPDGAGTRLMLMHELFPSEDSRDAHNAGWNGCLARLDRLFP